jgi:DNA-binding XRE family transcriptional regulator
LDFVENPAVAGLNTELKLIKFSWFVFGFNKMRSDFEKILKKELRDVVLKTRSRLNLTQEEMSELLSMSKNSYFDIEAGEHMCGTLTTVLLLLEQDDPNTILKKIQREFEQLSEV